jgi:hypothetical protein
MFIDLRVLFVQLHQPFIKSGVPYMWSGLGVHDTNGLETYLKKFEFFN